MARRPRTSLGLTLVAGALALGVFELGACGLPQRYRAAEDIRDFLKAVQADDEAGFEAHIDRPALRAELQDQLGQAAAGYGLRGSGIDLLLGGRTGQKLADQLITPESFRLVWRRSGLRTDTLPPAAEIAALLRLTSPGEACLHALKSDRCVLTFRNEGGTWKLAGVAASAIRFGHGFGS